MTKAKMLAALYQPVEGNEWEQWKARVFNQMVEQFGNPGLVPLEQHMWRSKRERRCIECGGPPDVEFKSIIIAVVSHYYMCQSCADWWNKRG